MIIFPPEVAETIVIISKLASRNSPGYSGYPVFPGYLSETVGKLQFEPTLPDAPGVRITAVLTNSLKLVKKQTTMAARRVCNTESERTGQRGR